MIFNRYLIAAAIQSLMYIYNRIRKCFRYSLCKNLPTIHCFRRRPRWVKYTPFALWYQYNRNLRATSYFMCNDLWFWYGTSTIFFSWILIIILLQVQIHDREKRWKKLPPFFWGGVQVLQHVYGARSGEGRGKYEKLLCKLDYIFRVAVRVIA